MILLYLDESGSLDNPNEHFVVGGLAVHESDVRSLNRTIDAVARRHLAPHLQQLELHAQWIRAGKGPWGRVPRPVKESLLRDVPGVLGRLAGNHGYALFAVARAPGAVPAADPLERSFEELLLRFTQMLIRLGRAGDEQLGLVIADKAKYELVLQPVVQRWRTSGTRFVRLTRLAEVPLFIDSRSTRLTQAADFVAHAVYRHYQAGDGSLLARMLPAFDTEGGVLHGLVHLVRDYRRCPCPACVSRVTAVRLAEQGPPNDSS
ncbi:MAG TPA: DUF3800 domain-containing protein [Gaiellaceae bacterium]|nr:DUF3800 domain-containing protein [Gaiellaceae bacterium]